MPKSNRVWGTVAGVNHSRGFFFICGPDGRDYFAWVGDLPDHRSLSTLIPQQTRIKFLPEERPKGPAATELSFEPDDEEVDEDDGGGNR